MMEKIKSHFNFRQPRSSAYTFETYRDKQGEHRLRLRAQNGNIVLSGEGYTRHADLMKTLGSVLDNIKSGNYKVKHLDRKD